MADGGEDFDQIQPSHSMPTSRLYDRRHHSQPLALAVVAQAEILQKQIVDGQIVDGTRNEGEVARDPLVPRRETLYPASRRRKCSCRRSRDQVLISG